MTASVKGHALVLGVSFGKFAISFSLASSFSFGGRFIALSLSIAVFHASLAFAINCKI